MNSVLAHLSVYDNKSFELGKLHYERCDFNVAIGYLNLASEEYYRKRDFNGYLKSQNMLLRIYAEKEQLEQVQAIKEKLQDLVLKEGFELNSKTYYTLALCASYRGQDQAALDYLQKSLAIALAHDNKEDICFAIYGIALCYVGLGKNAEALNELYNLQVFFQVIDVPEVRIAANLLNAIVLRNLNRHDQAIDVLWKAYDMVKEQKTLWMQIYLLYGMGKTYLLMGDKDMARLHLNLASRAVDPANTPRLARNIESDLAELGVGSVNGYDLVFEPESHTVTEKKLGKVDFKNQFILLDLLKLFMQNQGSVYSKEYLVEHIWKQAYDPAVHDNKIYVTIKRLRKMIEPDYDKPKYIFRAKNGYFMNKAAKVHFEKRGIEQ